LTNFGHRWSPKCGQAKVCRLGPIFGAATTLCHAKAERGHCRGHRIRNQPGSPGGCDEEAGSQRTAIHGTAKAVLFVQSSLRDSVVVLGNPATKVAGYHQPSPRDFRAAQWIQHHITAGSRLVRSWTPVVCPEPTLLDVPPGPPAASFERRKRRHATMGETAARTESGYIKRGRDR
jgi:hypothetical protein